MPKEIKLFTCESGMKLCASGIEFDAWLHEGVDNFGVNVTTDEILSERDIEGETIYKIKSNSSLS